ncbi:hypothetical protein PVAP13_2KG388500 [Panicum virgatum]|uniref:DUF1279 domain-containing protein n=1 Tax=Panicum virgatum TaxID=38727 RepID=A0A8T0WB53_PANVG|nr:hypothetical protein PVAP13_2KG388500 [Panicum virgatum]
MAAKAFLGRLKENTKVFIGVHFSVSFVSVGGLYVAINNNVDVEAVFRRFGMMASPPTSLSARKPHPPRPPAPPPATRSCATPPCLSGPAMSCKKGRSGRRATGRRSSWSRAAARSSSRSSTTRRCSP